MYGQPGSTTAESQIQKGAENAPDGARNPSFPDRPIREVAERDARELLQLRGQYGPPFSLVEARVSAKIVRNDKPGVNEQRENEQPAEATIKVSIQGHEEHRVDEGVGPVDAFSKVLRKALREKFPEIESLELSHYEVANVHADKGTADQTIAVVTFHDRKNNQSITISAESANVFEASAIALCDAMELFILRCKAAQQA